MTTVGLKELKESLGLYVARAREGERVVITDRGREVAELVPLSAERQSLMDLVNRGDVAWSGDKPGLQTGVTNTGSLVSDAVIEDRE